MLRKNITRASRICIVGLLLAVAASGCNLSKEGYRTLTVEDKLVSYRLEYPRRYDREGPELNMDTLMPSSFLDFYAPERKQLMKIPGTSSEGLRTVTVSYVPASISFMAYRPKDVLDVSQSAREVLNEHLKDAGRRANYSLLEQSPITMSGIEGGLIAYILDWTIPFAVKDGPQLKYKRIVALDYGGYIWVIEAMADTDMVEQVKADFDHIVQTFEILDNPAYTFE